MVWQDFHQLARGHHGSPGGWDQQGFLSYTCFHLGSASTVFYLQGQKILVMPAPMGLAQ